MTYTRIVPLTSVRFFAAVFLVIFHYGHSVWPFESGLLHKLSLQAGSAVAFFFFLSGFILTHVYHGAQWGAPGVLKRYLVSRFARIYPIYALALLVQFCLVLGAVSLDRVSLLGELLLLQVHALLIQSWLPDTVTKLNIPGWFLSVQAGFYLLFPLIINRFMRLRKKWLLPSIIVLYGASQGILLLLRTWGYGDWYYANQTVHNFLLYYPLVYCPVFFMGIFTYRITHERMSATAFLRPAWMALLSMLSLIGIIGLSASGGEKMWYAIHVGLLSPFYGLLIWSLCDPQNIVSRLLSARWLSTLGEISLGIYILQMPLYGLLSRWFPLKSATGFYVYLLTLILIAYLLHKGLETPMRRWIQKRWLPSRSG